MESRRNEPRPRNNAAARTVFAIMALLSVLAGLAVHLLQAQLRIPEETARLVSSAFLLVGIIDTLVLYFWDRIANRHP